MCELLWLKILMMNLLIPWSNSTNLYSDSKFAISIACTLVHHDRTKHVEINRHFIKKNRRDYQPILRINKFQEADTTKAMPKPGFESIISKMGMIDIYSPA